MGPATLICILPVCVWQVWVCPSTSGAAAMTNEDRIGPYKQLGKELESLVTVDKVPLQQGPLPCHPTS